MRIYFIGCVDFFYKALEKLISIGANIVGVTTKKSSILNSDFCDLTPLSLEFISAIEDHHVGKTNLKKLTQTTVENDRAYKGFNLF